MLADGIHGQELSENNCYKEIQSQMNLKSSPNKTKFNFINLDETIKALIFDHGKLTDEKKKRLHNYQVYPQM